MKRFITAAGAMAALLAGMSVSWAEDKAGEANQELDNVVVSATMTEKTLEDVPGSVDVITSRQIEQLNARTVAEALEQAAGLIVSTSSGRGKTPNIRGMKSNHVLILMDGRRLASGFGDLVDLASIPTLMVERIEVVRGPSSSLYGSDALGGVVNIITKKPVKTWKVKASGQYGINIDGDGGEYIGGAYGNGFVDRFSLIAGGEWRGKDKWDRITDDEFDDGDRLKKGSAAARFALDLPLGQVVTGGFEYNKGNSEGYRFMEGLKRNRDADDERLNYYLQYDAKIKDVYQVMLRLNRSEYTSDVAMDPTAGASEEGKKENYLNQAEGRFSGLFFKRHLVTVGVEFREEGRRDSSSSKMDVDNLGFLLQDEYQILEPLYLVAGVRFDDHSKFGSQWTPRVSLIYDITDHLRVKGGYGRGFRAPNLTELFVATWKQRGKKIYEPNSALDPEKSDSYEIGVEGEYGKFRGGLTFFRNEMKDMIEPVYTRSEGTGNNKKDYYRYRNISSARTQGIELESGIALPYGFSLTGNFAWMDTRNKDTGKDLEGQPDYKGDLKVGYDHPGSNIHANVRMSYIGRRYYEAGDEGGYALFNCYVSKGINRYLKVFAGIDNMFDKSEAEPTFFYTGITVSL